MDEHAIRSAALQPDDLGVRPQFAGRGPIETGTQQPLELGPVERAYRADEALAMGLVSRAVPDGEVLATARSLAARYSRRNRDVVAAQKRILNEAGSVSPEESLRREGAAQVAGVSSAVTRNALREWLDQQQAGDGDSVFLTAPGLWVAGEAVDLNPRTGGGSRTG